MTNTSAFGKVSPRTVPSTVMAEELKLALRSTKVSISGAPGTMGFAPAVIAVKRTIERVRVATATEEVTFEIALVEESLCRVPELVPYPGPTASGPKLQPPLVRAVSAKLVEAAVRLSPSNPKPNSANGAYRLNQRL